MSAGVQFLMDPGDTLLAYEQKGLEEPFGQNPLEALISSMDPVERLKLTHREFLSEKLSLKKKKRQLIDFD